MTAQAAGGNTCRERSTSWSGQRGMAPACETTNDATSAPSPAASRKGTSGANTTDKTAVIGHLRPPHRIALSRQPVAARCGRGRECANHLHRKSARRGESGIRERDHREAPQPQKLASPLFPSTKTTAVTEKLEPQLGIPISGINATILWYALRENGFTTPVLHAGRLLRDF